MTGAFAVSALIIILIAGWLLDRRGASEADRSLAQLARASESAPEELVVTAARANRIVVLSDIHNSAAVKEFAARAIARMAASTGLDAVILEIGADQQPYIDQYFDRSPEDASVLLSHPRTLREPGAATRAYLEIYHTIWGINEKLGADQRIRVIAADLPGWRGSRTLSPAEMARAMAERPAHMHQVIAERVLGSNPSARVLVFMTGFHALKSGALMLQTGGSDPVDVVPLAERLAAATNETYSILVDAPSAGSGARDVAPYVGTRVASILENQGVRKNFGTPITSAFDYLRYPIIERKTPGIQFAITPRDYELRDIADGYVNITH
ncbi:MAG: hypothetical protein ACT443_09255 [Gemmatimonadota bacterium]